MDARGEASWSFDRASDYYDRTRSLGEDAMRALVSLLAAALSGRGAVLEIGVGTGRIALPLGDAGVPVTGVDLSARMLAKLVEKRGGKAPIPLAVADATALPFRADAFGAGLVSHVLHLIPAWRTALDELLRVVRPRGTLLISLGGWQAWWRTLGERFAAEAGIERSFPGVNEWEPVDDHLRGAGAARRDLPLVLDRRTESVGELIDRLEAGLFSFTWQVPPATRRRAAEAARSWARTELGSLEEPRTVEAAVGWRAYTLPG